MPSDRKPSLILPFAGVALLLLAAYVGAYNWRVEIVMAHSGRVPLYFSPSFSLKPSDLAYNAEHYDDYRAFFAPMHWFDRYLFRPATWDPPDE